MQGPLAQELGIGGGDGVPQQPVPGLTARDEVKGVAGAAGRSLSLEERTSVFRSGFVRTVPLLPVSSPRDEPLDCRRER